jgi:putative resolvase
MEKLVGMDEAADLLGVCKQTLRLWDNSGYFKAVKTKGGHRRYRLSDIAKFQMEANGEIHNRGSEEIL